MKRSSPLWILLTSGTNGGSTMPASSRLQCIDWKNACCLTCKAPVRLALPPRRCDGDFASNCWHNDLASSLNLDEYFSGSFFTRRSTSSRLTFSFRARNGAWPSIISYNRQPKLNQSGLKVYFSLSITSGAKISTTKNYDLLHKLTINSIYAAYPCIQLYRPDHAPSHPRVFRQQDPNRISARARHHRAECSPVYSHGKQCPAGKQTLTSSHHQWHPGLMHLK